MIEKDKITTLAEQFLEGSDRFLVRVTVGTDNSINVYIDGDNGVTIADCVDLSRHIEQQLDREAEDFELNVSSAGVDHPFDNLRQYRKNIGRAVEIVLKDGTTKRGILDAADEKQVVIQEEIIKKNKKSRKMIIGGAVTINMDDIARAKTIIIV